jgi:phage tail sheath protein FI
MTLAHGINHSEVPTAAKPPVRTLAGLPVYTGTATINAGDLTKVNKPVLCFTETEFVAAFGPISSDFANWTLHEAAKAHFRAFSVAPIVCINVIDPENEDHVAEVTGQSHQLVKGKVKLQVYGGPDEPALGILKDSVVVKEGVTTRTLGTDYTLAFDKDGYLVVSVVEGGALSETDVILVDFDYLDPSGVTADDIIGGVTGNSYRGLEVVTRVAPALRLVPGFVLAPKWSQVPEVAARMQVLAALLNANFRCSALMDLSTDPNEIGDYTEAPAWKSDNGFNTVDGIACWPKFKNGDDVYHMSTQAACAAGRTDNANGGIPFASFSNKALVGTAAVDDDGNEILLDQVQADFLNKQGIVTALNGFNGWRLWGNRTAGYPDTTDPKDAFIPIRRMFNWIRNTEALTLAANVDDALNRRSLETVANTMQLFLNGLIPPGALIDGRVEFREDENPITDLSDGIVRFHKLLTPPSPMQQIDIIDEYDPTALAALFA